MSQPKHQLEHNWNFTYKPSKPPPQKGSGPVKKQQSENDWLASFKQILAPSIDHVELFWKTYNNVPKWSKLSNAAIYAFFKEGINPSWEDPANKDGCSYMFYMNQSKINSDDLDNIYEHALLFLIGNCSEYSDAVNGITFERKLRGDKMIVWCNSHSEEMLECITKEMFPSNIVKLVSLKPDDFANNDFKVTTKIVDHKHELARLSIPNKHHNHNHHNQNHNRDSDRKK